MDLQGVVNEKFSVRNLRQIWEGLVGQGFGPFLELWDALEMRTTAGNVPKKYGPHGALFFFHIKKTMRKTVVACLLIWGTCGGTVVQRALFRTATSTLESEARNPARARLRVWGAQCVELRAVARSCIFLKDLSLCFFGGASALSPGGELLICGLSSGTASHFFFKPGAPTFSPVAVFSCSLLPALHHSRLHIKLDTSFQRTKKIRSINSWSSTGAWEVIDL